MQTRLNLGCGQTKRDGFIGVDIRSGKNVDIIVDLREPWPFGSDSVDEAYCSHFVEHLTGNERIHFFDELYLVLKPNAKAKIITPHWSSCRAYGDPTHAWPPISEYTWQYLNRSWRDARAPHVRFRCNFNCSYGYSLRQDLLNDTKAEQLFAAMNYRDAIQDMIVTLEKLD